MAGSKETPRQRMIGMMYLVLTALLALQVSSALIYKFQSLNDSLQRTVALKNSENRNKLQFISSEVDKRKNPKEIQMKEKAQNVNKQTEEVIKYIDGLKQQLIDKTGGLDDEGNFKGAKEETEVEVMMIGSEIEKGKAYELKEKLNNYVKFVNQITGKNYTPLALDAKDDPSLQNNEEQKNKDFAHLNFGQTPLVAALAVLTELETRVVNMESSIINEYASLLGIDEYKVAGLIPMVKSNSKIVPAGLKYEAEVFMTANFASTKPEIFVGDQSLKIDQNGIGKLTFTASGGNYDVNGNVKKTWTGKIKIKTPEGKDTVYTVTEEYTVAKPVIQIKSASVQSLYKGCGNKLDIQVPALGNSYDPRIEANGANVIRGNERGVFTIVPTSTRVNLKVSSAGNFIGEEVFKVRAIPRPEVEVKVGGQRIPGNGVSSALLTNVSVKALAEKTFAEMLPDDSKYRVVSWEARAVRGRTVSAPKAVTGDYANLVPITQGMTGNYNIVIERVKVQRRTYQGTWEDVDIGSPVFIIPVI